MDFSDNLHPFRTVTRNFLLFHEAYISIGLAYFSIRNSSMTGLRVTQAEAEGRERVGVKVGKNVSFGGGRLDTV
jgi:hypothetical protein